MARFGSTAQYEAPPTGTVAPSVWETATGNSHRVPPFVSVSGCGEVLCGSIRPRIRGESCWLAS